jgi:polyhydroxyalkanoate synthesis regulator phasin
MSSQVISYRLSTDEVLALRRKALPGESDNQTAQRLMRESLGLSTELSTQSTTTLDERIESILEERLSSFAANQNALLSCLQERLQQLETQIADLSSPRDRPSSPLTVDNTVDEVDSDRDRPFPTIVDSVVDNVDEALTQAELSKRLGVDSATLTKNRAKPNFSDWSQSKDPKGTAWSYLPEVKRYSPILSTEVSTSVDRDEDLVGDRWKNRVDEVVATL